MRRLATFSARGFWPVEITSHRFRSTRRRLIGTRAPSRGFHAGLAVFGLLVSFLTILLESLQLVVVKLYYNYILAAIKHFRKGLSKFFLMFEKLKITGLSSAIAIAGHMFANGP
mgnify:FL=1